MKRIIILALVAVMMLTSAAMLGVSAEGLTGSGTESDPYKISTPADLDAFAAMTGTFADDMYFVLTNDIKYTDYKQGGAAPAKTWPAVEGFLGTFDGQGYTISGLYFADTKRGDKACGFIANTGIGTKTVTVKNLNIADSYMEAKSHVGSIVGKVHADSTSGLTILNCSSSATIKANNGTSYAGGILGYCGNVKVLNTVEGCLFTGNVSGGACVGGIVGQLGTSNPSKVKEQSYIKNCLNLGSVSGIRLVGGILGRDYQPCNIVNCVNAGDVSATSSDSAAAGSVCRYNQFGSISGYEASLNKDSYYLASKAAKNTGKADAASATDGAHKSVDAFNATNCPSLSLDAWVYTTDGVGLMLKAFVKETSGGETTTEAPVVTTESPVVTTEEPVVTTEAPDATTTEPEDTPNTGDYTIFMALAVIISVAAASVVLVKKVRN